MQVQLLQLRQVLPATLEGVAEKAELCELRSTGQRCWQLLQAAAGHRQPLQLAWQVLPAALDGYTAKRELAQLRQAGQHCRQVLWQRLGAEPNRQRQLHNACAARSKGIQDAPVIWAQGEAQAHLSCKSIVEGSFECREQKPVCHAGRLAFYLSEPGNFGGW